MGVRSGSLSDNFVRLDVFLRRLIGVWFGEFDYLADLFRFDNSRRGRAKSWAVTFLPPLALSLMFPFGFVVAIGYAGAAATVWACIIPAPVTHTHLKLPTNSRV